MCEACGCQVKPDEGEKQEEQNDQQEEQQDQQAK
jgi:hypothetical protein